MSRGFGGAISGRKALLRAPEHMAVRVENVGGLEAAVLGENGELGEENVGAHAVVLVDKLGIMFDGVRDLVGVGDDQPLIALHVAFRDMDRIAERRLHPRREPRLDAEIERDHGEDGDQDRRDHRDRAEQHDEAHMQPRACDAGAAIDATAASAARQSARRASAPARG